MKNIIIRTSAALSLFMPVLTLADPTPTLRLEYPPPHPSYRPITGYESHRGGSISFQAFSKFQFETADFCQEPKLRAP